MGSLPTQKEFIDYLVGLSEEGETPLVVRQKIVQKEGGPVVHADGTMKATWVPYLPGHRVNADWAIYGNTASFIKDRLTEKISASAANCEYVLCMVLDDIGTKAKTPPLEPTWIMETSEGSFQWGYTFSEQPTKHSFTAAIRAIADAGFTDPGATNAVRNFRLPGSVNLKPGKNGFRSRIVEFHPEREFTLEAICSALGVTPGEADTESIRPIKIDGAGDDVLAWLNEQGMVLSRTNSDGWCGVVCPNHHMHSTPDDVMARYQPSTRSFCCYHGHCEDLTSQVFLDWVAEHGGPAHTHGIREDLISDMMSTALSKLTPSEMFGREADEIIESIEQKELGRISKADWYTRFAYIIEDEAYFDMLHRREISRGTFNALYRHIECKSIHTQRKVEASITFDENRQRLGAKALVGLTYAAGESEIIARDGELFGNRWVDARPQVNLEVVVSDAEVNLWLDHACVLVPDEDERGHMLDMMAYKLQHPGKKINHAILHAGKEGCGKDTLWAPFIWAVCGPHLRNRGFMDNRALGSAWGYHLESEIILINELREPNAADRRALANELKPIIAAPPEYLVVNRKGLHPYQALNRAFVLAFSNDPIPISLASQDRRWFCVRSNNPRMSPEEGKRIWDWYQNGGFEAVAAWMHQRDVSAFNPAAAPIETEFKQNLIEGGMSISETYLVDMINARVGEFQNGVIGSSFGMLCERLSAGAPNGVKVPQGALFHALEEAGWVDMGRLKSARNETKKRVFAAPDVSRAYSKSELRDMVEEGYMPKIVDLKSVGEPF